MKTLHNKVFQSQYKSIAKGNAVFFLTVWCHAIRAKCHILQFLFSSFVAIDLWKAENYYSFVFSALRDMNSEEEYLLLDGLLEDIKCPMLCLWGENDEVLIS